MYTNDVFVDKYKRYKLRKENKMKLFKIELDNVGYDDYDSCVIVAESKEQVEELCEIK